MHHHNYASDHSHGNFNSMFEKLMVIAAIVGPLASLPQGIDIYVTQNSSGVSLLTWILFLVISFLWFVYGLIHKEKLIILTYILYIIFDFFIIVGILMY
ncbi:hypothetical protein KC571_03360 [candidate division WWE3 bacterium]|uniref:Uncharacterized protein n=1 Tax=candidate division WWE3 bacterium TaxID=2053526 RepID=A0A955RQE1_UNCKA|nr:hypothetical protein [candidate division WWE3 bacterium]